MALQLPPLCLWIWKEANGEGAVAGVLVLWEEGSVPRSHWYHIRQAGAPSGCCGNGPQEAKRRGRDVPDVAVHLELSSGNWSDREVVSPLPAWEREVVEGEARQVPRELLRAKRRGCATAPQGDSMGWQAGLLLEHRRGKGTRQEAGGCWQCPGSLARALVLCGAGEGGSTSCQSG